MAVLLAGLPVDVPGTTVNRLCGSGLDAVAIAARAVRTGEADLVIAGGVESMDLTGIDIGYHAKLARHAVTGDPRDLPSRTVTELVERGDLGRKTGKGFYTYEGQR